MKDNTQNEQHVLGGMPDLLEIILDKDNWEPIPIRIRGGRIIYFEPLATIPYVTDEEELLIYVVLRTHGKIDGLPENTPLVFRVVFPNEITALAAELDEHVVNIILDKFDEMIEELRKSKQEQNKTIKK